MEKEKYYVNLGTQEISLNHDANNDDFIIQATPEEIIELRTVFDEMYIADEWSFYRSHVPARPYHKDKSNDEYDEGMKRAFRMLHDLGDETTKHHIESMGVLEEYTQDD
ncbi:hydrolase [Thalassobacillus hwangdonensis]|uniref:Hydrolase n=1 Tax=Thalassobacillus hwangdonensis TaxID=546108 RepID=A0ABW3L624_9BACI